MPLGAAGLDGQGADAGESHHSESDEYCTAGVRSETPEAIRLRAAEDQHGIFMELFLRGKIAV